MDQRPSTGRQEGVFTSYLPRDHGLLLSRTHGDWHTLGRWGRRLQKESELVPMEEWSPGGKTRASRMLPSPKSAIYGESALLHRSGSPPALAP